METMAPSQIIRTYVTRSRTREISGGRPTLVSRLGDRSTGPTLKAVRVRFFFRHTDRHTRSSRLRNAFYTITQTRDRNTSLRGARGGPLPSRAFD